ncbi:MAG: Rpn family recombination-promoting nuclease/putative transposase [Phascolarctobacterium sp.]|nr:Rpn family recombination-promoting nuclease/putative transposase [Phascolarctobacterium sp.]
MAEKDISQKILEDKPDVFADIVNGLCFNGKEVIKPDELQDISSLAAYDDKKKYRYTQRDITKLWKKGIFNIACLGIENQIAKDNTMPLRVIAYDGAQYKIQANDKVSNYYPVITLVLYFGKTKWKKPLSLFDLFDVLLELKPFTNDYKINLFDISHMNTKEVSVFKSDFWHIADYFSQINETNSYIPSKTRLTHPEETFKLMSFLTGNEKLQLLSGEEEGGPNTMYDAFKEAQKEAAQESRLNDIRALMDSCNWTAKQAMDALKLTIEEQNKYLMLL